MSFPSLGSVPKWEHRRDKKVQILWWRYTWGTIIKQKRDERINEEHKQYCCESVGAFQREKTNCLGVTLHASFTGHCDGGSDMFLFLKVFESE